jgi:hypothetical protein
MYAPPQMLVEMMKSVMVCSMHGKGVYTKF